eukprot:gene825-9075_t
MNGFVRGVPIQQTNHLLLLTVKKLRTPCKILEYLLLVLSLTTVFFFFSLHYQSHLIKNNQCLFKETSEKELNSQIVQFTIQGCFYCNYTYWFDDTQEVYFAKEKGLLYLTKKMKKELNVSIYQKNVTWEDNCFGTYYKYVYNVIGYDSLYLNSYSNLNKSGAYYSSTLDSIVVFKHIDVSYFQIIRNSTRMIFVYVIYFLLLLYILKQTHLIILKGTIQFQQFLFQGTLFSSNTLNRLGWYCFETAMYGPVMFCCMHTITEYFQEKINAVLLTGTIWVGLMFMSLWTHSNYSKLVFPWLLHFFSCLFIVYSINYPFYGYSFIFYGASMLFLFYSMIFLWNHYDYFHLIQNGMFHPFILNQQNENLVIQVNQTTIERNPPLPNQQENQTLNYELEDEIHDDLRRRRFQNDNFNEGEATE